MKSKFIIIKWISIVTFSSHTEYVKRESIVLNRVGPVSTQQGREPLNFIYNMFGTMRSLLRNLRG